MSYELIHDATELRKLIAENPELPIVVLASEEANIGEWCWQYCNNVSCEVQEILDVKTPYDRDDGIIFHDKSDFEEAIADHICDLEQYKSMSDKQFCEVVQRIMAEYNDCWVKVIAIYASN